MFKKGQFTTKSKHIVPVVLFIHRDGLVVRMTVGGADTHKPSVIRVFSPVRVDIAQKILKHPQSLLLPQLLN